MSDILFRTSLPHFGGCVGSVARSTFTYGRHSALGPTHRCRRRGIIVNLHVPGSSRAALVALCVGVLAAGCSSTSAADEAREQELADQLVTATQEAGVAPRLTPDIAAALYGTDASAVCDAFDGGTTTSGDLILRGNTALGRRKTVTDQAVTYAGLVIETYCPDVTPDFDAAVADLDPIETSN